MFESGDKHVSARRFSCSSIICSIQGYGNVERSAWLKALRADVEDGTVVECGINQQSRSRLRSEVVAWLLLLQTQARGENVKQNEKKNVH